MMLPSPPPQPRPLIKILNLCWPEAQWSIFRISHVTLGCSLGLEVTDTCAPYAMDIVTPIACLRLLGETARASRASGKHLFHGDFT